MGERIRRMTARELERLLKTFGFELVSQKGSHRKWRQQNKRLQVIVPEHRRFCVGHAARNSQRR